MSMLDDNSGFSRGFVSPTYDISPENIKKPPLWPIIVQGVAIFGSLIVWALNLKMSNLLLSVVCYVFTPFIVFGCLALLRAIDLTSRNSAFYDHALGKTYLRIAGTFSLVSFLVAVPVVYRLATEISQL